MLRPPPEPDTIVMVLNGQIDRADIPQLCDRVRELLARGGGRVVVCDVGAITSPDAVTVEALARLQLVACRLGREIRLRHASRELRELLTLAGLHDVVPLWRPATHRESAAGRRAGTAGRPRGRS